MKHVLFLVTLVLMSIAEPHKSTQPKDGEAGIEVLGSVSKTLGDQKGEHFYLLARDLHGQVNNIKLDGKSASENATRRKQKDTLLESAIKAYHSCLTQVVDEWYCKSKLGLAKLYSDYAEGFRTATIFGSDREKIEERIAYLQLVPSYYEKSIGKLIDIIKLCDSLGITNDEVSEAKELLMEYAYKRAYIYKEIALLCYEIRYPEWFNPEEQICYGCDDNRYIENMVNSLPLYEQALEVAKLFHLGNSEWTEKMKAEISLVIIETGGHIESKYKDIDLDTEKQ